tara:strand:- start:102 stop:311 length:210 start_codon:yes stop_codon:yes gene_type:complete
MNRTYEDMSKEELVTLVTRLTKQHDEWSAEAEQLREELKEARDVISYALEMSSDDDSTRVFEDYLEVIE